LDILAILGLSALLRALRRPRGQPPATDQTTQKEPLATRVAEPRPLSPRLRLLLRAGNGLLLAVLMLVAALLPWPTTWATSAMLVPYVHGWQLWTLNNVDLITIGAVLCAVIEPLLAHALRLLCRLLWPLCLSPRLLVLLIQLAWVSVYASYWRFRNWRVHSIVA
jgi:hypothetical protein